MLARSLALAIGAVAEQRRWFIQMAPSSVIAKVDQSRPVAVFPVPGASTGTGVSSAWSFTLAMT